MIFAMVCWWHLCRFTRQFSAMNCYSCSSPWIESVLSFWLHFVPKKTQRLYEKTLITLWDVAEDECFLLKPKTFMIDFELGLENAIKKIFNIWPKWEWSRLAVFSRRQGSNQSSRSSRFVLPWKHTDKRALIFVGLFQIITLCSLEQEVPKISKVRVEARRESREFSLEFYMRVVFIRCQDFFGTLRKQSTKIVFENYLSIIFIRIKI